MAFEKITESESLYNNLEDMSVTELLVNINTEDKKVAFAVEKSIPQITALVDAIVSKLEIGGRLFYIGAGTSGRLGIVDASECPPTFGVSHDLVIGLMAGGDNAMRKAVEFAEDSVTQGWNDLQKNNLSDKDVVIGIAASGTTPYVIEALKKCNLNMIITGCITCNADSPLASSSKFPIEIVVGSEFITGSSRMKAGTAQKMVLNMISTSVMVRLGKIKGNRMIDMQLSNEKLVERAVNMVVLETNCSEYIAQKFLKKYKTVRLSIEKMKNEKY